MRSEKEVRQYRDALAALVKEPCSCRRDGHLPECMQGRLLMDDAARTLTWVLGEGEELAGRVETFVAAAARLPPTRTPQQEFLDLMTDPPGGEG